MKFTPLSLLSAAALFAVTASAATSSASLPNLSEAASSQSAAKDSDTGSSTAAKTTGSDTSAVKSTAVITGSGQAAATTGSVPTITGGSSATDGGALPTDLPTIAGAFVVVAPSVPPTADAPFMQASRLPEGTVFIVVGALLGFLAMSVFLWRVLVAWSLHRSVKRAAMAQALSHEKSMFRAPVASLYRYKDHESSLSLANLKSKNRKSSRPESAVLPSAVSQSSLFFSPTAGAAVSGNNAANRVSSYLPAGYYAAGAAQAGNGQGTTNIGHQSISMTNLNGRESYARAPSLGPSPPGSPQFVPHHGASSSTIALNQPPGDGRAPSVYLDDLFDRDDVPPLPNYGQHRY